jgi:hypothetical protein
VVGAARASPSIVAVPGAPVTTSTFIGSEVSFEAGGRDGAGVLGGGSEDENFGFGVFE